jgi:hypothetical protein
METEKNKKNKIQYFILVCFSLSLLISACGNTNIALATPSPIVVASETLTSAPMTVLTPTSSCIDDLTFISDVTIQDYSVVEPGSILDKQWLIQNSGSCNWDSHYRLRLIDGDALGAIVEQALFPARAGMQTTLRIIFTAPQQSGEYLSEWQAYNPEGIPFGKSFFMKIVVQ